VSQVTARDVSIRAFRGTRRSSVYRECIVPEPVFSDMVAAGEGHSLPTLSSLDADGPHQLDKSHARKLAREVAEIGTPLHEPHLTALIDIARWCAHAKATSWLTIAGLPRAG
jgi:hypothetical protein